MHNYTATKTNQNLSLEGLKCCISSQPFYGHHYKNLKCEFLNLEVFDSLDILKMDFVSPQ